MLDRVIHTEPVQWELQKVPNNIRPSSTLPKRDTPSAFDLKTIQTKNNTCHTMMSLKPTKAQI